MNANRVFGKVEESPSLFDLLTTRREAVLAKCREKTQEKITPDSSSPLHERGLTALYDQLVDVLRVLRESDSAEERGLSVDDAEVENASRDHAREAHRLGFTVAQLVHGYGSICQGITEYAHEVGAKITAQEFSQLNLCLDQAIAQSVSEFQEIRTRSVKQEDNLRMGFLVHELRNSLSGAMMAHEMIRSGGVGTSGATSVWLATAHDQIKNIIDRAIVEIRLGTEPEIELGRQDLSTILSDVECAAYSEARLKGISLQVKMEPGIQVRADAHLLTSAIANLVQNGIKFTRKGGSVTVRVFVDGTDAIVEVEDRCGGFAEGKLDELFKPFVLKGQDQSGLGLGLSISKRTAEIHNGRLMVRNLPGVGCVFVMSIPRWLELGDEYR